MRWKEILKAARYARKAHAGQQRAHGAPYFTHPRAVARVLWQKGHREPELIAAAYLHDVLEDTGADAAEMQALFGPGVMALVSVLTKRKGEPREDYFRRIKQAGPAAMALKTADREHNNSELWLAPAHYTELRRKAALKTDLMARIFSEK